jgi:hypothetical protein
MVFHVYPGGMVLFLVGELPHRTQMLTYSHEIPVVFMIAIQVEDD